MTLARISTLQKMRRFNIFKRKTPAPRNMYGLVEHLNKKIRHPISGCANLGSSESDPISV